MASLEVLNPATNEVIETLEYTDEATAKQQIEKHMRHLNLGEK